MGTVFERTGGPLPSSIEVFQADFPTVLSIPKISSKFFIGEDLSINLRQAYNFFKLDFITIEELEDETLVKIGAF